MQFENLFSYSRYKFTVKYLNSVNIFCQSLTGLMVLTIMSFVEKNSTPLDEVKLINISFHYELSFWYCLTQGPGSLVGVVHGVA